jgi:hypothetical protein
MTLNTASGAISGNVQPRVSGRFSFWCREDWCEAQGMYKPDRCKLVRHSDSNEEAAKCALMITDFPSKESFTLTRFQNPEGNS